MAVLTSDRLLEETVNSLYKKAEFLSNICIIIVAVLIGFVLVRNFILDRADSRRLIPHEISSGEKISSADFYWAKSSQTLLVAVSKGCHFCSESRSFYQRLVELAAKCGSLRVIALVPHDIDEGKQYLREINVDIPEVRQARFDSMGIIGTPSLILVDREGIVSDVWPGKLQSEKENQVISRLQSLCTGN